VAECAGLVAIDREFLVKQHQLAEQFDLLDLIIRSCRQALQRIGFDPVYLGHDTIDLGKSGRQKRLRSIRREKNGDRRQHRGNGNANADRASDAQTEDWH
jgi:hypothetical protein